MLRNRTASRIISDDRILKCFQYSSKQRFFKHVFHIYSINDWDMNKFRNAFCCKYHISMHNIPKKKLFTGIS